MTTTPRLTVTWVQLPNGLYQTKTVDPKNGKTYLGEPVPKIWAVRLGMKA